MTTWSAPPTNDRGALAPGLFGSAWDVRHTGNTLAAASDASTRELMHRMGHGTMRAALMNKHATSERDRENASAVDRRIAGQGRCQR
ncbi:hypothetical protein [Micromonospora orduensis]|uniref:hypothetical protein n=1 Tax=Micromonospora orduensis TaxID=1420891 RepID=UPI0033DD7B5B